ncbi:hypothetical protein RJ55_00893 [Drechmeria coniospora]|nr:hypothetical protein RJ55_00893 [Drechmeria coniospora]
MPSLSAFALVAAAALPLVNAAPHKREVLADTIGPAPYRNLPPLGDAESVDLDLSSFKAFNIPENTDKYKCHATCGILIRVSAVKKDACHHPWALPLASYCFGPCPDADKSSQYSTATKFRDECNFDLGRAAREAKFEPPVTPKDDEKDIKGQTLTAETPPSRAALDAAVAMPKVTKDERNTKGAPVTLPADGVTSRFSGSDSSTNTTGGAVKPKRPDSCLDPRHRSRSA